MGSSREHPLAAKANKPAPAPPADATRDAAQSMRTMRLKELRDHLKVTQAELARRLDVVQSAVSKYELTPNPRVGTVQSVVEQLGGRMTVVVDLPGEEPVCLDVDPANVVPRRRRRRSG